MSDKSPVVKTPLGALRGTIHTTDDGELISCFQGIPYAKPPLGDLRFKDPVPIEPWSGVKSAENPPAMAPTTRIGPKEIEAMFPSNVNASEDCLYLQVFVPELPDPTKKLPVMVYIHGGGFVAGTGNMSFAGPDYLVPKGVILVNINYRLGALGFLSLGTPEYPGNSGLKDQSLALKWVKNNIGAFGGDADNVTIFGISAGSASVHYHVLSPLSRGLFHRAFALSGSALNRWAVSRHPVEKALILAKRLGCTSDDPNAAAEVLQKATWKELIDNTDGIYEEHEGKWGGEEILSFCFVPSVEPEGPNAFLTKTPEQAVKDGDYADVPYVTGVCADEAIFILPSQDYKPDFEDSQTLQKLLPKELEVPLDTPKMKAAAAKLKEFYFPNGSTREGWIRTISALTFTHGIFRTVREKANDPKKTTPSYLYVFAHQPENSMIRQLFQLQDVKGVSHGEDSGYILKMSVLPLPPPVKDSIEYKVQQTFSTLLTDFGKSGKVPEEWKVADPQENYPYIEIAEKITPKVGFFADEMKLWDEIYEILNN